MIFIIPQVELVEVLYIIVFFVLYLTVKHDVIRMIIHRVILKTNKNRSFPFILRDISSGS